MAYTFGTGNSDIIDMGTAVTHGATFSLAVRFAFTTSTDSETRVLACFHDGSTANVVIYTSTHAGYNEEFTLLISVGGAYHYTYWDSGGLTPGSIHTVVGTYDGTNLKLFFDTDASQKVTVPYSGGGTPDQGGAQHFCVGNPPGGSISAHATIYEVAWYPGTVLTGAQAATLGAGGQMPAEFPLPMDYYFSTQDAVDLYGGHNGTVTGAILAAASGTPWFPRAGAATYYVKTGGNDSLDGLSTANAWATISKVNATTLAPGDTVQFNGGDTFSGNLAPTVSGNGDPDAPVTITSYGTGKATLTSASGHGILFSATSGIEVSDLIVRSTDTLPSTTTYGDGIRVDLTGSVTTSRSHFYVDHCEVYDFSYAGIACWGGCTTSGGNWDDVRITNCHTEGNQSRGVVIANTDADNNGPHMTNVYVADCVSINNPGTGGTAGIPNQFGDGFLLFGCDGGTIERCLASGNGDDCSGTEGGPSGIILRTCSGTLVQFNEACETGGGGDGFGIDCDVGSSACVIQYNYTHGNKDAGLAAFNGQATFRYNISENDLRTPAIPSGAIYVHLSANGNLFYGNTVYLTPGTTAPIIAYFSSSSINNKFFNNIFITSGSNAKMYAAGGDCLTGMVLNGNAYWQIGDTTTFRATWDTTTYTSLADFRTGASQETGTGYNLDPEVTNPGTAGTIGAPTTVAGLREGCKAYRLAPGSWAQGAGLDLDTYSITSPGTEDFFGLTLPTSGLTTLGASLAPLLSDFEVLVLFRPAEARV